MPCIFDLMSKIFIPGLPSLDESHPDYVPSLNLGYRVKSKSARMEEYAKSIERCVKKSLLTDSINVSLHNIFAGELPSPVFSALTALVFNGHTT